MLKYIVKADDGCDIVMFEFENGSSAMAFAQAALEHLGKKDRTYHEGGVKISIVEVKPEEKPDDDGDDEKDEEDE